MRLFVPWMLFVCVLGCGLAFAGVEGEGEGETLFGIDLEPARDNTIFSDANNLSNGAGQYIFSARTQVGGLRRALLFFDVTRAVPAGAAFTGAELILRENGFHVGPVDVSVHLAAADWGEGASNALGEEGGGTGAATGDATWSHRFFSTVPWTSPGGDFDAAPIAAATVGGNAEYAWSGASLLAAVAEWHSGAEPNNGVVLVSEETVNGEAKRFGSRENPNAGHRPRLRLNYTLPPPDRTFHSADTNASGVVELSELLRVIQFFNLLGYHCDTTGADGFAPGAGVQGCFAHASDFSPEDWSIALGELLRLIQFFNIGAYHYCPGSGSEDGYCPGAAP